MGYPAYVPASVLPHLSTTVLKLDYETVAHLVLFGMSRDKMIARSSARALEMGSLPLNPFFQQLTSEGARSMLSFSLRVIYSAVGSKRRGIGELKRACLGNLACASLSRLDKIK
jgi:hypothetical protein